MNSRFATVGLFALLATLWGFSFPAIDIGLRSLDPVLFAAFRYDIAAVLLLAAALARGTDWRPTDRSNLLAVLAGGLFLVAGNGLLFVGQQTVPSGVAAIMQSLGPIVTSLWALAILPQERLSPVGAVGILVGFVGVGLIVRPDPANLLAGDGTGRLLILGQVVSVALGGVLVQRAKPTLGQAALSGWSMLVGGVVLHATSLVLGESLVLPSALQAQVAVLYLGVFATAVAFFIYFTLLEMRGALETSLVAYLVPIVATVAGVFLLGESITPLTVVGFLVVFVGFVLLKREEIANLVSGSPQPAD
ncbi:Permease of the drug/metabolite transporter (DMT) superfamily [Halogranum gelatinilyticum]|uniref:Permease of the drug/metabolite transporter (DMT) superfamily n=1 Tax=Halogranum gelatinilyticum TaxID=660521 RepID=A0A1G9RF57_9EURY|nr:EamA family transporter [Halogranum gelatinilyticum]SDM21477.1 Permease of the drug/metabolite transporter (DMT) superfamily [Halogranum gelatinilyticum]